LKNEFREDFEKKSGIAKAKVGLVVCSVLVVILVISSIWLYAKIGTLQNQVGTFETERSSLQSEVAGLETQVSALETDKSALGSQVTNLETQKSSLQNEIDSLNSNFNSLKSKYDSYVATYTITKEKYDDYVSEHLYTNEEYESARFDFYYVVPAEQKFGVYDLEVDLFGLEWLYPYEENVFDCSEMSAYLEWYLENLGWHTYIILGEAPFGGGYHAWLLVETSLDQYMPVESTTIKIIWWADPDFDGYFIYDYELETILDALSYNESEFDWWK